MNHLIMTAVSSIHTLAGDCIYSHQPVLQRVAEASMDDVKAPLPDFNGPGGKFRA